MTCLKMFLMTLGAMIVVAFGATELVLAKSASESKMLVVEQGSEPLSLLISTDFYSYQLENAQFSAPGLSLGFQLPIGSRFSIDAMMQQAYSSQDSFASLFTSLSVRSKFALTGSFDKAATNYRAEGERLLKYQPRNQGGFRISLGVKQFYFNTTTATVPYSGLGMSLGYELPHFSSWAYTIGVDADRITNGDSVIITSRLFLEGHLAL